MKWVAQLVNQENQDLGSIVGSWSYDSQKSKLISLAQKQLHVKSLRAISWTIMGHIFKMQPMQSNAMVHSLLRGSTSESTEGLLP